MSGKDLIKLLEKNGWVLSRINGSHHILKHGADVIIVPVHKNDDLKPGILGSILKKAGLK